MGVYEGPLSKLRLSWDLRGKGPTLKNMKIWGKDILGRGKSKGKGSEVECAWFI